MENKIIMKIKKGDSGLWECDIEGWEAVGGVMAASLIEVFEALKEIAEEDEWVKTQDLFYFTISRNDEGKYFAELVDHPNGFEVEAETEDEASKELVQQCSEILGIPPEKIQRF